MLLDHLISQLVCVNTNHIYNAPKQDTTKSFTTESLYPSFLTWKNSMGVRIANNNGGENNTTSDTDNGTETLFRPFFKISWTNRTCWAAAGSTFKDVADKSKWKKTNPSHRHSHWFYHLPPSNNNTISSRKSVATFFNVGWVSTVLVLFYLSNSIINLLRLSWAGSVIAVI